MSYKAQNTIIKFFDGYSTIAYKGRYKVTHGVGFKILTSKQMLQKLPVALAQVKAGNAAENLLNQIHQIIHSLYSAK